MKNKKRRRKIDPRQTGFGFDMEEKPHYGRMVPERSARSPEIPTSWDPERDLARGSSIYVWNYDSLAVRQLRVASVGSVAPLLLRWPLGPVYKVELHDGSFAENWRIDPGALRALRRMHGYSIY